MKEAYLEHTNLTVSDPDALAAILCNIFGWKIRWSGESMNNGYTVHVGNRDSYLAIYSNGRVHNAAPNDLNAVKNLNHLGIVVDDIKEVEAKVVATNHTPGNHSQYNPGGVSFYFHTLDNLEIEVISYA